MTQRLRNKIALVTGAANGIGRAIAERYAREGASVVVADIDAEGAAKVAREIVGNGGDAIALTADVSDEQQVDALFDKTLEIYSTLDILVNNAARVTPTAHILEVDKAWWDRLIDTNLTGSFLCALRAAHIMARKRSGCIINMSSGGATKAHRGFVAYDAAKGGVEAMTRAMALDLGPYNVRVNSLIPGSIDSRGLDEEQRKSRGENIPLGRIGELEDMTGPAVYLASDDALYVTGQRIVVDGGMLIQQRSATVDIFPLSRFPELSEQ